MFSGLHNLKSLVGEHYNHTKRKAVSQTMLQERPGGWGCPEGETLTPREMQYLCLPYMSAEGHGKGEYSTIFIRLILTKRVVWVAPRIC